MQFSAKKQKRVGDTLKPCDPHLHCSRPHPLASFGSAREDEPSDSAANQKTNDRQNCGEPHWHAVRAIRGEGLGYVVRRGAVGFGCCSGRWSWQAVHLGEDVWMLLKETQVINFHLRGAVKLYRQITRFVWQLFLPQWGIWCCFWHLWNCCMSVFYPLARTRDQTERGFSVQFRTEMQWEVVI